MELIPAPWTDEEVVLRTQALMTALGQEPIRTTREIPGFVLNRLQGALLNEAFKLVQDGIVSVDDVDKTIREGLGLRWAFMGPFETIDLNAPGGMAITSTAMGRCIMKWRRPSRSPANGTTNPPAGSSASAACCCPKTDFRPGRRGATAA